MYVYIYIYIYIYIHIYIYIYIHNVYISLSLSIYIYIYIYTHIHLCIYNTIFTCLIRLIRPYMCVYIYIYIYRERERCIYIYIYVLCVNTYVCIYIYIYICFLFVCFLSCQNKDLYNLIRTTFTAFEESLCWTSSVRQVVPPDTSLRSALEPVVSEVTDEIGAPDPN